MGMFDTFIGDYMCPHCHRPNRFEEQIKDYDNVLDEFYLGDYVDKGNRNYYYHPIIHQCRACSEENRLAIAIRNGQYADILLEEEIEYSPIESIDNIEDGFERKRAYNKMCEDGIGEEEWEEECKEKVKLFKPGDTISVLRKDWTILEAFQVIELSDHNKIVDILVSNRYIFAVTDGKRKRRITITSRNLSFGVRVRIEEMNSESGVSSYIKGDTLGSGRQILIPMGYEEFVDDFMERFVKSDAVKKCMEEEDISFSDKEIASIIYNAPCCYSERKAYLNSLSVYTQDKELKEDIIKRLEHDKTVLDTFMRNKQGFVYTISADNASYGTEVMGFFSDYEIAKYYLKEVISEESNNKDINLVISKNRIINSIYEIDSKNLNRHCMPVAEICFNSEEYIQDFWSTELNGEIAEVVDNRSFENLFVPYPCPFEKGDRVKVIESGKIGSVAESRKDWENLCRMGKEKGLDVMDAVVLVDFDDGTHEHIAPIYLDNLNID